MTQKEKIKDLEHKLFKDLGSIVCMVTKENTEMQKWYLDNIKESLKEINTK